MIRGLILLALGLAAGCVPVPDSSRSTVQARTAGAEGEAFGAEDMAVDFPLPPNRYRCEDGREVASSAYIGGVYLSVDGAPEVFVRQTDNLPDGYRHEGQGLGWDLTGDTARLATLEPGQTMENVAGVDCARLTA